MKPVTDMKRRWTAQPWQRRWAIVAVLLLLALYWIAVLGVPSKWKRSEWLSLLQVLVTGLGFVAAAFAIRYAAHRFEDARQREKEAWEAGLSQIRHSLKSELATNPRLLVSEGYKIWSEPDLATQVSHAIHIRPLKISAFELMIGREDLKYLKPEELDKTIEAYDQIKDFNNMLEAWLRRAVLRQEAGHYSRMAGKVPDLALLTSDHLGEMVETARERIDEALKALSSTD